MVMRPAARRAAGFTYVGLIVLVAIIGLVGAATLKVDALLRRAAAEEALLDIGAAFGEALRTYAEATPRGQPTQPPSLQELLKDPRFPGLRRHLRKIFVDPMTGKTDWGIVWANPGNQTGVLAVYSLSAAKPFKVANFDARFPNFENKDHISDWKFAATGQAVAQGQVQQAGQAGQPQAAGQGTAPAPNAAQAQPSLFQAAPANAGTVQDTLFPAPAAAAAPSTPAAAAVPPTPEAAQPQQAGDGNGENQDSRERGEDKDAQAADPAAAATDRR